MVSIRGLRIAGMGEERRPPVGRRAIMQMVVIGLVASAIGIALGLIINWFPPVASTQAKKIDTLYDVLVIVSVPFFVLVVVVVLFSVLKFRMRPGEENIDGPPIHGNTRLEIVWTAIPALILVSLCTYAYITLTDIEEAPAKSAQPELKVDVTGQQFAWTYRYTGTNGKPFDTTELMLPKGRSVRFAIHAKDVIHDFWVPAFRVKLDAVPGITGHYRVTPTRLGSYPVVCAELCGLGHAYMRSTVTVVQPKQFQAWLAKRSQGGAAAAGGAAAGGGGGGGQAAAVDAKALFTNGNGRTPAACAACHTLAAAGATGTVGPDLGKALKGQSPAQIEQDIVDPNKVITKGFPASVMPPNYGQTLSPQELKALVKYLHDVSSK
jgi:cytochrome c oxidase subunit II